MRAGDKVKCFGVGRVETPKVHYFPGDVVEATLHQEVGSGFWLVKIPGDVDSKGRQELRVRRVL